MRKNLIITGVIIWSVVFISTGAFAKVKVVKGEMHQVQGEMRMGPGPGPRGMMGNDHMEDGIFFGDPDGFKKSLGLSDDQVEKMGRINLEYKKKLLKLSENIQPKQIKLQRLLLEDDINLKEVRAILEDISDIQVEIRMLWINQRVEIEKVLTPEQKNKLKNSPAGIMRIDR